MEWRRGQGGNREDRRGTRAAFLHDERERDVRARSEARDVRCASQGSGIAAYARSGDLSGDVHRIHSELSTISACTRLRRLRETLERTGHAIAASRRVKGDGRDDRDEPGRPGSPVDDGCPATAGVIGRPAMVLLGC